MGTNTAFTTTNITPPPGRAIERGLFTGPSFQNFNASITKGFNIPKAKVIGEGARVEFRADIYNVFNQTELTAPTATILSTTFGQSQGALGSRTIELQSRFSF